MKTLLTNDRRHAIAQWLETNPATTNAKLAEKYGVSTRTISQDRATLRKSDAREVELDGPLAALRRDCQRNIEVVQQGKASVRLGPRLYLDHCVTAARLALGYLKSLQAVGVIPKNIGRKEIMRWDFVSPTPGMLVCDPASGDKRPVADPGPGKTDR